MSVTVKIAVCWIVRPHSLKMSTDVSEEPAASHQQGKCKQLDPM
jgi:hypothetical protein